jgi:hypothetical protein
MADFELLTLGLRAPLDFRGFEDPPFPGLPVEAEGEEELFLFDEDELVAFDPDDGPRLRRPLPRARFYGRRPAPEAAPRGLELAAASYVFLQWRPRGEAELEAGLEWFAREAWWGRYPARGPYILRRVREDGGLATQALRRLGA